MGLFDATEVELKKKEKGRLGGGGRKKSASFEVGGSKPISPPTRAVSWCYLFQPAGGHQAAPIVATSLRS